MKFRLFGETVEITGGPNVFFWVTTAGIIALCWENQSLVPLAWWLGALVVFVPISVGLAIWNAKQDEKLLRDFPHDPYIQRKYGRDNKDGG